MKNISGLNYYNKLDKVIDECILKSSQNPFEMIYFIVEDPLMVEELFLQKIDSLINIEIMTFHQFMQKMIIDNHMNYHQVINNTELTYRLYHLLKESTFECFDFTYPLPLISLLIPLLKEFDLCHIESDLKTPSYKLNDFLQIYSLLMKQLDQNTHLSIEDIMLQCIPSSLSKETSFYIEGDSCYHTKQQEVLSLLDKYFDVTVLYTYQENDSRLLNSVYKNICVQDQHMSEPLFISDQLFQTNPKKDILSQNLYTFEASTPHQEVDVLLRSIKQKIVDEELHYNDFVVAYPDSSYIPLLTAKAEELNMPHSLIKTTHCQYELSYREIVSLLENSSLVSTHNIVSMLLEEDLEPNYVTYLTPLSKLEDSITSTEFLEFFKATYLVHQNQKSEIDDCILMCPIEHLKSASPKYIYILGMNETVLPKQFKDNSLLLDEDTALLKEFSTSVPLTCTDKLALHQNALLKALQTPYISMTFSYAHKKIDGSELLPSSLYKQIHNMFELIPLPFPYYKSLEEIYAHNTLVDEKLLLNRNIAYFKASKNQPLLLENASSLYAQTMSVSQIETYNKCPFLYFIQYGLKVYPSKEDKLLPQELGSITHFVLEKCEDPSEIHHCIEQFIKTHEELSIKINNSSLNRFFITQMEKDLTHVLITLSKQRKQGSFEVYSTEQRIEGILSDIQFKGFIDRIDTYDRYLSIIDYKSSAKSIDLNLAMQGFNIQMIVYLKLASASLQKDPAGVLYFNTKKRILSGYSTLSEEIIEEDFFKQYQYDGYIIEDNDHPIIASFDRAIEKKSDIIPVTYVKSKGKYKGHILRSSQLNALFDEVEKHICSLYEHLMQGHIGIEPKGSDDPMTHKKVNPCKYCHYKSICNFDLFYNDYKKVENINIAEKLGGDEDAI